MNTHYAVATFSGDPANEHPDTDLRGCSPRLHLLACGSYEFCWDAAANFTRTNPLRLWENIEILQRVS